MKCKVRMYVNMQENKTFFVFTFLFPNMELWHYMKLIYSLLAVVLVNWLCAEVNQVHIILDLKSKVGTLSSIFLFFKCNCVSLCFILFTQQCLELEM